MVREPELKKNPFTETLLKVKMFLAVRKLNLIETTTGKHKGGLSNPSAAPCCKNVRGRHNSPSEPIVSNNDGS